MDVVFTSLSLIIFLYSVIFNSVFIQIHKLFPSKNMLCFNTLELIKSMLISEQEILELKELIFQLNGIEGSVVIVEGKRDSIALRKIGFTGKILEFHRFSGMINFADSVAKFERLIVLFDWDKKGRMLTRKTIQLLQRKTKIDLTFKRKLRTITMGKIMFVEQLASYEPYLAQDYGQMPL